MSYHGKNLKKLFYFVFSIIFFVGFGPQVLAQTETPQARFGCTMTKVEGDIYLYGGYSDAGGKGCVIGGLWKWDYEREEWIDKNPTNTPPGKFFHSAAVSNKTGSNDMYVFFGADGEGGTISSIWSYNPPTNEWNEEVQNGSPIMEPRFAHSSSKLSDGRILAFGGFNENFEFDSSVWVYDPSNGTWEKKSDFPGMYRYGHKTVFVNNKVQLFGGVGPDGANNQMWDYDMTTDTWELQSGGKTSPGGRQCHAMVASDVAGKIWVLGGDDDSGGAAFKDVWEFDVATKEWTQLDDLPFPRTCFGAALLTDENETPTGILIFGGKSNGSIISETYIYPLTVVGVGDDEPSPKNFRLSQNYPNPFSKSSGEAQATTIEYSMPKPIVGNGEFVMLNVFNILGQKVAELVNEKQASGNYSVRFNAVNLPSGIYFYTLRAGNFHKTKKMIIIK